MSKPLALRDLASIELLDDAELAAQKEFLRNSSARSYPAESIIFDHQSLGENVFFVLEGQVRINVYAMSGRWVTYELLGVGSMFGELSALDHSPRSASVIAETDTWLASISGQNFRNLVSNHESVRERVFSRLTTEIRQLMDSLFEYHALDVKGRIYSHLIRIADTNGSPRLTISDRDMASRVGTTRENVTRIYAHLRRSAIIERQGRTILITDIEKLRQLIMESEFS